MIRTTAAAMTAQEVTQRLLDRDELFILDVRNEDAYADWKIEGTHVQTINIPYYDLLDDISPALNQLPPDKPVLVVCAQEGSAKLVADQIAEADRGGVHYLAGGMKAWSEYLEPVKVADLDGGGELYQFVRIGKGCLSYMILSDGEAAIIDPARVITAYELFMQARGAKLLHVLDTHLHADHISGGRALAYKHGATYYLPARDAAEVTYAYVPLEETPEIRIGKQAIKVQPLYTPGHTIGSTSFIVDGRFLLSGDTLFIESIGRPDLAGLAQEWVDDLRATLYHRYKALPEELIVLPAHYGKVTELGERGLVSGRLGDLYRHNPGLNLQDENVFRQTVTDNLPPQPHAYQEIRQANMGKINPDEEQQREMEIGPNRCAVHDH